MRHDDIFDIARRAAESESVSSQLPGRENGPADAYRHILWVAEMTRRFGESAARNISALNEEVSDAVEGENPLTKEAEAMDRWNNDLSIRIGSNAKTWNDVVHAARQLIERSPGDGTGKRKDQSMGARWLEQSKWRKNPIVIEEFTGEEIEAPTNHPGVNWITGPDKKLDWVDKRDPEPFIYRFGTENFRHKPDRSPGPMSEPMTMARNKAEPEPERRTTVAFQADDGGSETGGMLGDSMLVDPKDLSLDNKDRVRARLGFHAEDAGRDPAKRKQVARCMVDCFVREPGFEGLPGSLPKQLGGISATMSPDAALAVLREAVPEATKAEPPRRRKQPRRRQTGPAPLDQAGRAAVQQAVLSRGARPIQTGIAKGAVKKAVEGIGGKIMMGRELPGIFGAAFAPMGGAEKPMRAAAKTANAINQDAGIPDRSDAKLTDRVSGRESATAIERAIQAAGPEKFVARLEDDPGFGFGGGGSRPSRAGRSLLNA